MKQLIHILAYKLIWLSGVWGANHGVALVTPWLSLLYAAYVFKQQLNKPFFLLYVFSIVCLGVSAEFFIFSQISYSYASHQTFVPVWLIAIWVSFPCMCAFSLRRLLSRPFVAAGIGLCFGPLAYQGAASFGSIQLMNGWTGLLALSVTWMAVMLVIYRWLRYIRH